jgi:general secretion pathway protein H
MASMQMSVTGRWTNPGALLRFKNMVPTRDSLLFRSPQARGFSLLEILVVVFIIGILATMFTLSVGVLGSDSAIDKEINRLQALLELAREEAVMNGHELGLHFYPGGYEFAIYQEDFVEYYDLEDEVQNQSKWIVMDTGTLLKPRQLPAGIVIEIEIDGRDIVLKEKQQAAMDESDDDPEQTKVEAYRPQVWLYSSGDMSPFVIRFRREFANDSLQLEFSEDGTVELSAG